MSINQFMYAVWLNRTSDAKTEVRIPLLTSSGCLQKRTLTFKGLKRVDNDWILMIGWTFSSRSCNSVQSLVFQNAVSLKDIFPEFQCTQSNMYAYLEACVSERGGSQAFPTLASNWLKPLTLLCKLDEYQWLTPSRLLPTVNRCVSTL